MTAGRTNSYQISTGWCTPPKYANAVKVFFSGELELDPCSNKFSLIESKTKFMLPEKDGLVEEWNYKTIFVNPPYGSDRERGTTIKNWIKKCEEAHSRYNAEVLALIPVATNTRHWKDFIFGKAAGICFLYDTRLKFMIDGVIDEKGAPMSCAMVYWGNNIERFESVFSPYGAALDLTKNLNSSFGSSEYSDAELPKQATAYRRTKSTVNQESIFSYLQTEES